MTTLGWIFMTISLSLVWSGTFWCFYKVLTTPNASDEGESSQQ